MESPVIEQTPLLIDSPVVPAKTFSPRPKVSYDLDTAFEPFVHKPAALSFYEILKVAFFTVTIFPLRFITSVLIIFCIWLVVFPATLFDVSRPSVRFYLKWTTVLFCKSLNFVNGFWFVRRYVTDTKKNLKKTKKIINPTIVVNHVSWIDITHLYSEHFVSFIAKGEVRRIPLIGKIARAANCLFVDRSDKNSRQIIAQSMTDRMRDPTKSNLLVFPQGCTSDSRYLTSFQLGAFRPGKPVLPIVLKYHYKRANPSWDTRHFLFSYYRTACMFFILITYPMSVYKQGRGNPLADLCS
ncbi:hypothetical protein RCL1_002325 [Eukaryota sp. TZLM3-RCL]